MQYRIPRQPVLTWDTFGSTISGPPAITDHRDHVFTWSGRSALRLALNLLSVEHRDEVLVPNFYCPTMVAPVESCGARPVFFRILDTGTPDIENLERAITRRTRAVIAVHFFGVPINLDSVRALCDSRGIALIEDCSHAFFGWANGSPVGHWGDFSIGSLPKFFPALEGGVLVEGRRRLGDVRKLVAPRASSDNVRAAWDLFQTSAESRRLIGVSGLGLVFLTARRAFSSLQPSSFVSLATEDPPQVRSSALSDPTLAPVALRTIDRLVVSRCDRERIARLRRRNYLELVAAMKPISGARVLFPDLPDGSVPYVCPVWLDEPDRPYANVRRRGLPVFRWDRLWPGAIEDPSECGRLWSRHVLQISCHQDLSERDVAFMVETMQHPADYAG